MKTIQAIIATIALAFIITGCESTKATSGVNIFLNGKPLVVQEGTKIVTQDPMTGRFHATKINP